MKRRTTIAPMVLAAALAALPAFAQAPVERSGDCYHGWDWGWGHMMFGSLMMVLFWGAVIVVILLAVRWLAARDSQGAGSPGPGKTALDILHERLARGEIDSEEFEERKRLLSK